VRWSNLIFFASAFEIKIKEEETFTDSGALPMRTFSRLFIKHFSVKLKKGSTFVLVRLFCPDLPS
jgi:hypothetical protein